MHAEIGWLCTPPSTDMDLSLFCDLDGPALAVRQHLGEPCMHAELGSAISDGLELLRHLLHW